ncbi:hypothetical protein B566_EDAN017107 [Ephemera danica]|nr:hypothetical protein B566_EDAN017107 [Ephemera danica]
MENRMECIYVTSMILGTTLKIVQSHSDRRVDTDAEKTHHSDTRQQVSLDGRLVAALERSMDSSPLQPGVARASLNVPALGVAQTVESPLPPQQRRSLPQDLFYMVSFTRSKSNNHPNHLSLNSEVEVKSRHSIWRSTFSGLEMKEACLSQFKSFYIRGWDEQQAAEQQALERATALQQALQNRLVKKSLMAPPPQVASPAPLLSEEEYSELLQRLREADALYTELALEELVYQLAKELFSQRHGEAQASLQRFSTLLRAEADQGRIAHALESKLLDVLGASLMDALRERPLVNENPLDKIPPQIMKPAVGGKP